MIHESIRVEFFGKVNPACSEVVNHQLKEQLKEFDSIYMRNGGKIGSPDHQADREEFARIVSIGLIKEFGHSQGRFGEIETYTEYKCLTLNLYLSIKTKSHFFSKSNVDLIFEDYSVF